MKCNGSDTINGEMSRESLAFPPSQSQSHTAWRGDSPLRDAARLRLVKACERCILRDGLEATTLASVASEAGVSRPTVYRYFVDRDALVQATLRRGGRSLAEDLALHLEGIEGAGPKAVEAMLFVVDRVHRDPLLSSIWTAASLDAHTLGRMLDPDEVELARVALASLERQAGWSPVEAEEAVRFMLRLLQSLLLTPGREKEPARQREFLVRRMLPGLGLEIDHPPS